MAIDKKNSPTWYKVVVWVVLIGLVLGMVAVGLTQIFNGGLSNATNSTSSNQTTSTQDTVTVIDGRYQPVVDAQLEMLKAKPDDFDANNNTGQAYLAWAQELMQSSSAQALTDALNRYKQGLPYLKKAYDLKSSDRNVGGNYAAALYASGNVAQAVTVAQAVVKASPDFADGWYNLGIYLSNSSEANAKQDAVTAFRTAIEKDTSGTLKASAQQEIDTLNKVK